jgi:apolipoprotein N-acyltransferase
LRTGIFSFFLPIFGSIISGVLLVLAFPRYDVGELAWVGLVPLLVAISGRSKKHGFFLSYLCGIIFFAWVFSWTFEIPAYRFLHHAILSLYLGLYFGVFGLALNAVSKRLGASLAFIAAPFLWISLEYLRSNLGFMALPWALLAHSQYQSPLIIQFAAITGAYGISFLVMLVNSTLTMIILSNFHAPKENRLLARNSPSKKTSVYTMAATVILVGLALTYGNVILKKTIIREEVRTSVLQGNIDRKMKANPRKYAKYIIQKYVDLTKQAAQERPALIVWPEASTPGFILSNRRLKRQIVSLVREVRTHLLLGSSEFPKFPKTRPGRTKSGNTALLFSPEGKVLGKYLKIHLVPFGEYVPYEGSITWPDFILPRGKQSFEIPGREFTLFGLGGAKFGVLICWEIVFPELFAHFVKGGANFMLNITNEGWFGETAAPYQMASINVFRAVENRISVARAANTGISCFIDPYGRITGRVQNSNKDIFVEGHLTQEIPVCNERTFYTLHGDVFAHAILIISVFLIALSLLRKKAV